MEPTARLNAALALVHAFEDLDIPGDREVVIQLFIEAVLPGSTLETKTIA